MTEYRTATYRPQISQRARNSIRRAFAVFGRGEDARFLESIPRLHDLNPMIYACSYLVIMDGVGEDPNSISESKLFEILISKIGEKDNERSRLTLLFHVYVTLIMLRLHVPSDELLRKEGVYRKYVDMEDEVLI